jgi:hypothetical protein
MEKSNMNNEELRPCPNYYGQLHVIGKDERIWLKCDECEGEFTIRNSAFYRKNISFVASEVS